MPVQSSRGIIHAASTLVACMATEETNTLLSRGIVFLIPVSECIYSRSTLSTRESGTSQTSATTT